MTYTTAYTVINHDNGEVMGCSDMETLKEAVESREDFRGAKLEWVVQLLEHLRLLHPDLPTEKLAELHQEYLQAGWTPLIKLG